MCSCNRAIVRGSIWIHRCEPVNEWRGCYHTPLSWVVQSCPIPTCIASQSFPGLHTTTCKSLMHSVPLMAPFKYKRCVGLNLARQMALRPCFFSSPWDVYLKALHWPFICRLVRLPTVNTTYCSDVWCEYRGLDIALFWYLIINTTRAMNPYVLGHKLITGARRNLSLV